MTTSKDKRQFPDKGLGAALAAYGIAWAIHLYTGTVTLRGFFGDGSLAFLIHLSHSYVFNMPGHMVHLFSIGFPRDFQLLLNALGLQMALWLHIQDPQILKYIFVFWQFALPGFLYLGLFWFLWREGKIIWGVFPLISWAILSVPVDWNAVNSTRWAVPIFWMHFFLVLLTGPKIRLWPALGVVATSAAMLGGLYEIVVSHCALCLGLGVVLWWREKNKTPFIYALGAIPGAIRAALAFATSGYAAPNSFHGFVLPAELSDPYFFFIAAALAIIAILGTGKMSSRYMLPFLLALLAAGIYAITNVVWDIWLQIDMRFEYIAISSLLMGWAALLRILKIGPEKFAVPVATLSLLAGAMLWVVQIQQTYMWQSCHADYEAAKTHNALNIPRGLAKLFVDNGHIAPIEGRACLWDWTTPWADMLLNETGRIDNWTILTFWQQFEFVKKDGQTWLRTNNWTLTSPDFQASEGYLPLKTLLYDLTPLYNVLGDGPFMQRAQCLPPEQSGPYWRAHLMALDDEKRRLMYVCTRSQPVDVK